MADWFKWKGALSTDYGIHVSSQPVITLAQERVSTVTIPGRSGTIVQTEGTNVFNPVSYSISCFVESMPESKLQQIDAWLRGTGKLEFPTRPGGYYMARGNTQLAPSLILRGNDYRSFTVSFICQPFLYYDDSFSKVGKGNTLVNPYTISSQPVFEITGGNNTSNISLFVGNYTIVMAPNILSSGKVSIDCENMIAYTDTDNVTQYLTCGDGYWPVLEPGNNVIDWQGDTITKVRIQKNWRSL